MIDRSLRVGFSYGITSAVLVNLVIMVGLGAATGSKVAVISGLLLIAVAEFFSESLSIHLSRKLPRRSSAKQAWQSTYQVLVCNLIFAFTFIAPVVMLPLRIAVNIGVFWSLMILCIFSCDLAKKRRMRPWGMIAAHWLALLLLVTLAYWLGVGVSWLLG